VQAAVADEAPGVQPQLHPGGHGQLHLAFEQAVIQVQGAPIAVDLAGAEIDQVAVDKQAQTGEIGQIDDFARLGRAADQVDIVRVWPPVEDAGQIVSAPAVGKAQPFLEAGPQAKIAVAQGQNTFAKWIAFGREFCFRHAPRGNGELRGETFFCRHAQAPGKLMGGGGRRNDAAGRHGFIWPPGSPADWPPDCRPTRAN
jgi:hypothetical protein